MLNIAVIGAGAIGDIHRINERFYPVNLIQHFNAGAGNLRRDLHGERYFAV